MEITQVKNTKRNKKLIKTIDEETGEIQSKYVTEKVATGFVDVDFSKIWLGNIIPVLSAINNTTIRVIAFILFYQSENVLHITEEEISEQLGISGPSTNEALKFCEMHNLISRKKGLIMLNPDVIFTGTNEKRRAIIEKYNKLKKSKSADTLLKT